MRLKLSEVAAERHLYQPLLRPASSSTLPPSVRNTWQYVELPHDFSGNRPDLKRSKYPHGVISTPTPISAADCEHFDLKPLNENELAAPKKRDLVREAQDLILSAAITVHYRVGDDESLASREDLVAEVKKQLGRVEKLFGYVPGSWKG